ncbi:MAG TPA: carotenoid biosynthesis protein [Anaerolineae bacterium]|nr:carotenoid biosynthesis protein [Anaerolineae bacterium]
MIYRILFEILMLVLLFFCLRDAWRKGWGEVGMVWAGVIFGWMLEWATIEQLDAYEYGTFILKVGEVPLSIGFGWGVIIYASRLMSDASSLAEWGRPVLDALLAVMIDLGMDVVAIRLGMWDWGRGLDYEYFGVPYPNFWAWFWVVFFFSASSRLLLRLPGWWGRWLAPVGAIVVSTMGVLATNSLAVDVLGPRGLEDVAVGVLLLLATIFVVVQRPRLHVERVPLIGMWVPIAFHLYFLFFGLLVADLWRLPLALLVSVVMLGIGVWLHWPMMTELKGWLVSGRHR